MGLGIPAAELGDILDDFQRRAETYCKGVSFFDGKGDQLSGGYASFEDLDKTGEVLVEVGFAVEEGVLRHVLR